MRRAVPLVLLAVLVAAGCSDAPDLGAGSPSSTTTASSSTPATSDPEVPASDEETTADADPDGTVPDVVLPVGYDRVRATVTDLDGAVCELCLWLADTADLRRQGLMFVTDLGAADGMAFRYPDPHTGSFWMKNTVLPLSIAFFDAAGTYLDAFDMEPCTADPCPVYPTPDDFLVAIETTQGDLAELGIGDGSVLALSDLPCDDAG